MSTTITAEQIKAGDKIRVTHEFVTGNTVDIDGEVEIGNGEGWVDVVKYSPTIELLERKAVDLPTKKGTVIRVFSNAGEGRWMLTETEYGDRALWISAAGIAKNPTQMADLFTESPDRTFEVIA